MASGWVEVMVTESPDEAELARILLRDSGISSRLSSAPGGKPVEGRGVFDRIRLEVHTEDDKAARAVLDSGSY